MDALSGGHRNPQKLACHLNSRSTPKRSNSPLPLSNSSIEILVKCLESPLWRPILVCSENAVDLCLNDDRKRVVPTEAEDITQLCFFRVVRQQRISPRTRAEERFEQHLCSLLELSSFMHTADFELTGANNIDVQRLEI